MSIWEKLAGATAELLRSGPVGTVLGGVSGQEGGKDQVAFTFGVIALGAKMAKANGVVTNDEVNAFKEVFKVPAGEMKNVANIFNFAKQDVTGYQAYAEQLAATLKGNRRLLEDVWKAYFTLRRPTRCCIRGRWSF
jgi:DnaJ like chaperone protein